MSETVPFVRSIRAIYVAHALEALQMGQDRARCAALCNPGEARELFKLRARSCCAIARSIRTEGEILYGDRLP